MPPETAAEIEDDTSDTQVDNDQPPPKRPRVDAEGFAIPDLPQRASATPAATEKPKRGPGRPPGALNWRAPPISREEQAIEDELERDVDLTLEEIDPTHVSTSRQSTPAAQSEASPAPDSQQEPSHSQATSVDREQTPASQASTLVPSQASQASEDVPLVRRKRNEPPGPPVNGNIGNLNNISLSPTLHPNEFSDDEDVSSCLLSEEEQKFKEVVWVNNNQDWLRQDHAKRIKRELADAQARREGRDPDEERRLKLAGGRQTRKDGKPRQGKRGDPNSYLDPNNKPTDPNDTYRRSPDTPTNDPPPSDTSSLHSTRSNPRSPTRRRRIRQTHAPTPRHAHEPDQPQRPLLDLRNHHRPFLPHILLSLPLNLPLPTSPTPSQHHVRQRRAEPGERHLRRPRREVYRVGEE